MSNNRQSTGKFWLTKRPDSPVWYVATYDPIKRKTILRSTKTTEEAAAQKSSQDSSSDTTHHSRPIRRRQQAQ